MMADVMEAVGIPRGQYVIRTNNRKILDGVRIILGLEGPEHDGTWLTVMRALDKYDKFGLEGVRLLLGKGRKDESGDFTKGAELNEEQIAALIRFLEDGSYAEFGQPLPPVLEEAIAENEEFGRLVQAAGYETDRIKYDPTVIRGLEYYTGPVFEAEVTFDVTNDKGQVVQFGSVGGGGRYDGLVARFKGAQIPATGMSIGVSRLYAAMRMLQEDEGRTPSGPVVVTVMDRERLADYQAMADELRAAGIRAEIYVGGSGVRAQMKYADRRGAPCVVIAGEDEFAAGEATIKDLIRGTELSKEIEDNKSWREGRPAQFAARRDELVEAVKSVLARHGSESDGS
jgi:histidyl-tRNA synthetase